MSKAGSVYTRSQGRQREIEMERKSVDSIHGEEVSADFETSRVSSRCQILER